MGYSKILIKIKRPCYPEADPSPYQTDSSYITVIPENTSLTDSSEVIPLSEAINIPDAAEEATTTWITDTPTDTQVTKVFNSAPSLFCASNQGAQIKIPDAAESFPLIDVQVTTSRVNERVKIDATISTLVHTYSSSTFSYGLEYILYRDDKPLRKVSQFGDFVRQTDFTQDYDFHPNITFIDVPPSPGTCNYSIVVTERLLRKNVDFIIIYNLGLNAIVFPPVPEL